MRYAKLVEMMQVMSMLWGDPTARAHRDDLLEYASAIAVVARSTTGHGARRTAQRARG
jgi:hypothetical protein